MSRKYKRDKVYPIEIDNSKVILEALDECPWYFYKASKSLRKDKNTCLEAIHRDPYTVMFIDEKLRNNDSDIRNAIINSEKYLIKYVDEYGELIDQYKNEIPLLGIQLLVARNQLVSDNSLVNSSGRKYNEGLRDNIIERH